MSFMVKVDSVLVKYSEIWNTIKELTGKKLHGESIHNSKYVKTKVKAFNGTVHTNFHDKEIWKENTHYVCLAIISNKCRFCYEDG